MSDKYFDDPERARRRSKLAAELYGIFSAPGDDPVIDLGSGLPATEERLREAAGALAEVTEELRHEYQMKKHKPPKKTLH